MRRRHVKPLVPVIAGLAAVALVAAIPLGSSKYISQQGPFQVNAQYTTQQAENFELKEHKAVWQPDGTYTLGADYVTDQGYQFLPRNVLPKDPAVFVTGKTAVPSYLYIEVVENERLLELTRQITVVENAASFTIEADASAKDLRRYKLVLSGSAPGSPMEAPVGTEDWEVIDADNCQYTFTVRPEKAATITMPAGCQGVITTLQRVEYVVDSTLWGTPLQKDSSDLVGPHGGKVYLYKNGQLLQDPFDKDGQPLYILEDNQIKITDKVPIADDGRPVGINFYGYLLQREGANNPRQQWDAVFPN